MLHISRAQPMPRDGEGTRARCLRHLPDHTSRICLLRLLPTPRAMTGGAATSRTASPPTIHLQRPKHPPGSPLTGDGCYGSSTLCSGLIILWVLRCHSWRWLGRGRVSKPCAINPSQEKDVSGSLWQRQELALCTSLHSNTHCPYLKATRTC